MKKILFTLGLSLFILQLNAQDQTINGATFKQDGKVGIGTTNPGGALDIYSDAPTDHWVSRMNTNGNNWSGFWEASDNIYLILRDDAGNPDIYLRPNSSSYFNGGNVGIGTTNPSARLTLNNSSDHTKILQFGADGPTHWFMGIGNNGGDFFHIGDNSNKRFVIRKASGNIGIGTTTPNQKLSIQGDNNSVSVSQSSYNYSSTIPIGGQFGVWDNSYTNAAGTKFHRYRGVANSFTNGYIGQAYADGEWGLDFRIENQTSASDATLSRIFIKPNGNVGIGTTDTQGFKLGVNGRIAATEVKVATYANWPDFVFNSDYKLPTLKEVEYHIKEKGHLKDIPNAETIKNDGFYLAEMNAKLLQKIEELTLYTIEQQKLLELQAEAIKAQAKAIKELQETK